MSNNKGINLPGVAVSVPALSEKDMDDLRWGLNAGADFIALSFVRNAEDIAGVHKIMDEVGIRVPVIAKIEKLPAGMDLDFKLWHESQDRSIEEVSLSGKKEKWTKGSVKLTLKEGANDLGTLLIKPERFKTR